MADILHGARMNAVLTGVFDYESEVERPDLTIYDAVST